MEELTTFLLLPPVQGFLGGALVILIKMMVDWFNKTHFARRRRELRSYEALYDSINQCEARYSILLKGELFDAAKGKHWTKEELRQRNQELRSMVIEELIKMNVAFKWLNDKVLQARIERWEENIQRRIEATRKRIDEEPRSEEDQNATKENPHDGILDDLKHRLRKMARYDY